MSVGVIVPVYGAGARYLAQALDGVLAQDPAPDEVIVVDDGSPEPVRLAGEHAHRCRLVRRDRRGGPGPARDAALELVEAELVACADADDVWLAGKLAAQLRWLEREPGPAVCFGAAVIVDAGGQPTGERWREFPAGVVASDALLPALYAHNPIPTSSVVARRTAVEAAGGFSGPPLFEDLDLWLRLAERGARFASEPRARILYRRHPDGATADIAALARSAMRVHEAHAGLVDEDTRRRVRSSDLVALARGLVRERRYAEARQALAEAAAVRPARPRERGLRALLAVPGLRAGLGRRRPY